MIADGRFDLSDEPEPLLREGEWMDVRLARHLLCGCRCRVFGRWCRGAARLHRGGEPRDGRRLEDGAHRQSDAQRAVDAREHLRRAQRVSAQGEEVVVHADAIEPQHLPPRRRDRLLRHRARRDELGAAAGFLVRGRERSAVQLAVGGQRQALQPHVCGGEHEVRKQRLQMRPQFTRGGFVAPGGYGGNPVGGEGAIPVAVVARGGGGGADGRVPQQRRLHLAQLDAEAAHLHLLVRAPRRLHRPIRPVAPQIARAVEPVRRVAGPRVRHEPLGGQRLVAQVAGGQVRRADPDLSHLADPRQLARAGPHQELHARTPRPSGIASFWSAASLVTSCQESARCVSVAP
jgi:hypothetical protein